MTVDSCCTLHQLEANLAEIQRIAGVKHINRAVHFGTRSSGDRVGEGGGFVMWAEAEEGLKVANIDVLRWSFSRASAVLRAAYFL